jgi:hypothetical protein
VLLFRFVRDPNFAHLFSCLPSTYFLDLRSSLVVIFGENNTIMANSSIVNPDGTINTSRLEREIREDLALHRKHAAEDVMKKKAIHTSADYDEFKNFVSCAELKPTTSRDVSSLFTGGFGSKSRQGNAACLDGGRMQSVIGGYGESIQQRKVAEEGVSSTAKRVLQENNTIPKKTSREAYAFLRGWKQECTSPERTLLFLTRIRPSSDTAEGIELALPAADICREYFSTDIDSEILGDTIEGLHLLSLSDQVSPCMKQCIDNIESAGSNVVDFVQTWLKSLVGCGRIGLSLSFLSTVQSRQWKDVVAFVQSSTAETSSQYDTLLKK